MERFTQRARRVLSLAHQDAERMRQPAISTEHLLLGLIQEEGGIAGRVLRDLGLEPERVQEMVERLSGMGQSRSANIELSAGVQQVLEFAIEEARRMGHHYIGTEHLLLGLVRSNEGKAWMCCVKWGLPPSKSADKLAACSRKAAALHRKPHPVAVLLSNKRRAKGKRQPWWTS
jgi:ATP-dependent Clp protease ATP-binding subunit ClpC